MSVRRNVLRAFATCGAIVSTALVLAPAGASARERPHFLFGPSTFGATGLVLNASTATTLTSTLGLKLGVVSPAYAGPGGAIEFPITNSPFSALLTGNIDHSGGISLSAGGTTVDLTNFVVSLGGQSLSADVTVVGPTSTTSLGLVNIVGLSFSGSHIGLGLGGLTVGPIAATLNDTALTAVGKTFGVYPEVGGTITSLPLGTVTVAYSGWLL